MSGGAGDYFIGVEWLDDEGALPGGGLAYNGASPERDGSRDRRHGRGRDGRHGRGRDGECRPGDAECAERQASEERHTREQKMIIIACYITVSVVWVLLVHLLGLAPWTMTSQMENIRNPLGLIVFAIPLLVFGLGVASVVTSEEVCNVQNAIRGGNILYLGILVAIPLFTLLDSNYQGNRRQFAMVVLASITCAVLGQLDVWGTADWTCYVHHVESALKTMSIGLLLYALVMFAFNGKYFSKAEARSTEDTLL